MTLMFFNKALCTKACFGFCLCPCNASNKLSNKVGSTDHLSENVNDGPISDRIPTIKVDELQNRTSIPNNQSNLMSGWKSHDDNFQEDSGNGVIVKQPISKIKIVNVTYQKHYIKTNKIDQRRTSVARNGHVESNPNPLDTSSLDTASDGKKPHM